MMETRPAYLPVVPNGKTLKGMNNAHGKTDGSHFAIFWTRELNGPEFEISNEVLI